MKKARDSFYVAMRDRLQTLNPARQVLVRGVLRPGVMVEENESFAATLPDNVFVLRWTRAQAEEQHALVLVRQTCEIQYQSGGTPAAGGLDRGALMAAMDVELVSLLQPAQAQKMDYSAIPPAWMGTNLFWTSAVFAPVQRERDRLTRKAEIVVMSYEKAGEA
jgi:hypothetical protein